MVDGNDWCVVMFVVDGTGIRVPTNRKLCLASVNEKLRVFVRGGGWTLMCVIVSNRKMLCFPVKHMF